MTKLKNNLRKSMRRTNKQKQRSKSSRKSRRLRRQTRSRRSKMRGGMNMMGLLALLFAVLKTDPSFKSENILYEPNDQFNVVKDNVHLLQNKIDAGKTIIPGETIIPNNFNLESYINEMNEKKQGTSDDGFNIMLKNEFDFSDYQKGDSGFEPVKSDVESENSGYSKQQYYRDNNIPIPTNL